MPKSLTGESFVVIDPAKLAAFIRSPQGPVVRRMLVDGQKVKTEARRLVGKKSGNLQSRILVRVAEINHEPAALVGVEGVPYALWHHEGTRPHVIRPRRAPLLVFFSARAGKVIRTKLVHHPGTKPNRFLVNALRVLRNNV